MKTTRSPHSTPLPELAEFLAPFRVPFQRSEGPQTLERYLTEHPNTNCDTTAQVVPGTSEQRLQGLLTTIDWDEDDLNRQRVQDLLQLPSEGDGTFSLPGARTSGQRGRLRRPRQPEKPKQISAREGFPRHLLPQRPLRKLSCACPPSLKVQETVP